MHLLIAVRGIKHEQDRFINELSTRYLPFPKYHDDKFPLGTAHVQLSVRPICLYELVFPEEHLNTVIATTKCWGFKQSPMNGFLKGMLIDQVVKTLGYEPMPEIDETKLTTKLMMYVPELEVIGLGIKKDRELTDKDGNPLGFEAL